MRLISSLYYVSFVILLLVVSCQVSQPVVADTKPSKNTQEDGRQVVVRQAGAMQTVEPTVIEFTPDPYSSLVNIETPYGILYVELFFDAGEHRMNFVKLVKESFYDSLLFHRVIKNFMAQGGDPNSRNAALDQRLGSSSSGYQLAQEIGTHFFHVKGALAAARAPDEINPEKKSSGSQFYIVQGSNVYPGQLDKNEREYSFVYSEEQRKLYYQLGGSPQLDMEYTVFGRVYKGFDVIDSLCAGETDVYARPIKNCWMKPVLIKE